MGDRLRGKALLSPLLVVGITLIFAVAIAGIVHINADQPPALPPDKQALLDSMATAQAELDAQPTKAKDDLTVVAFADQLFAESTMTPFVTPTPVIGIRDIQLDPFASQEALIENQWQDWVGTKFTHVYAGVIAQDADQGFVGVSEDAPGQLSLNFDVTKYLTPTKDGAVKIASVNNLQFTLVSEDETTFIFDLPSRTFE